MFLPKNTLYRHRVTVSASLNIYEIHGQDDLADLKMTTQPAFIMINPAGPRPMSSTNNVLERTKSLYRLSASGDVFAGGKALSGIAKRDAVEDICKILTNQFKANHFSDRDGDKTLVLVVGQSQAFHS